MYSKSDAAACNLLEAVVLYPSEKTTVNSTIRHLLAVLLVAFFCADVMAQEIRDLPRRREASMEGREFVIGFMQNEIIVPGVRDDERSLVLYIASDIGATVRIQYGDWGEFVVTIPAGGIHVEQVPIEFMVVRTDRPEKKGIFISASSPVVVYGMNTMIHSTDTFMAIPVRHLGKEYIGVSRKNETYDTSAANTASRNDPFTVGVRQGCMLIVAPQSQTTVTITPAVDLEGGHLAGIPFGVTLERGQTYFLKSAASNIGLLSDLTGTIIQSNTPVAVFSGNVRASVYDNLIPEYKLTKDHLVEQLLPVSLWGTKHATIPFATMPQGDQVRIVPSAWPTVVEQYLPGGIQTYVIRNRGDFLELNLRQASFWIADNPVQVVQCMRSLHPNDNASLGDPAMVVVPPVERFSDRALFQVPRLIRQRSTVESDYRYFIILVAELEAAPSLTINSEKVTRLDGDFLARRVPGVPLCYARLIVEPGRVYTLRCDQGRFSGVMYGVGPADSYANVFGMSFDAREKSERTPPQFDLSVLCGSVSGVVRDSVSPLAYLEEVSIDRNRTFNYEHRLDGPSGSDGRYTLNATVTNPWQNARIVVQAYDTMDIGREWDYFYDAPEFRAPNEMIVTAGTTQSCQQFSIVNVDTTPMNIESMSFVGDSRFSTIPQDFRGAIQPGDSLVITVCFDPPREPLPDAGRLTLTFSCNLVHQIPVRALTSFSLRTEDIDFGVVRLGDTACASAWIVNNGPNPMQITALDVMQAFPEFVPQIQQMALPRTLPSQGRLEVPVCVVPQALGLVQRRDTVRSMPYIGVTVGYRVVGVRPEIPSVTIRWPNRRVGTSDDSTVVLFNRGLCNAVLTRRAVTGNAASFDISAFTAPVVPIDSVSSVVLRVQFIPEVAEERQASIVYSVDWTPHDTVRITLQGIGTLPTIDGFDADLGTARVGQTTTIAAHTLFTAGGNENLTIDDIALEGNDAAAFGLPSEFMEIRSATPGYNAVFPITFTPSRVGFHSAVIRIVHDAAPSFARRTTLIQLVGNGFAEEGDTVAPPLDPIDGSAALIVPPAVLACDEFSGIAVVNGVGTVTRIVTDVDLSIDGRIVPLSGPELPSAIESNQQLLFTFSDVLKGDNRVVARLHVRWADGADTVIVREIVVRRSQSTVTVTLPADHSPGQTIDLRGSVAILEGFREPYQLGFSLFYATQRLNPNTQSLVVRERSTGRILSTSTIEQPSGMRVTIAESVALPTTVDWQMSGQSFWFSPSALEVSAAVNDDDCVRQSEARSVSDVVNCASSLRMVRLNGGLSITVPRTVVRSDEDLVVQFEAGSTQTLSIDVVDASSRSQSLWENVALSSGQTVVNFAFFGQASGAYVLRVRFGSEAIVVPILVIK
jgi:hypothetical protein